MKPIVIIDTFPNNHESTATLNRCIDSFNEMGYDIMVVSHIPLTTNIAKKCKYVIYDYDNTFLSRKYCPTFYNFHRNTCVDMPNSGHVLPICRNLKTSTTLAKALGYKYFIFTECDVILHHLDKTLFDTYTSKMIYEEKKMLFFKPKEFLSRKGTPVYESLLFGGEIDYFTTTFPVPINEQEWLALPMHMTLEESLYELFNHDEDKFLMIGDHSSIIFEYSEINTMRVGLFNCEIVHNQVTPEKPVLYIMNYLLEDVTKYIDVYINGKLFTTQILIRNQYWFYDFPINGDVIDVIIYNDEAKTSIYLNKAFVMNDDMLDTALQNGSFKFI